MDGFIDSRIEWRFHKIDSWKEGDATNYVLRTTAQVVDRKMSGGIVVNRTSLFGDIVLAEVTVSIRRNDKGKAKDTISVTSDVVLSDSGNGNIINKDKHILVRADKVGSTVDAVVRDMLDAVSEEDNGVRKLTQGGKKMLTSLARKRDDAELGVKVFTEVADRFTAAGERILTEKV